MEQVFLSDWTLNFNLRQPKSKTPTMVYAVVYINGKQRRYSTGVKVIGEHWNKKLQRAYTSPILTALDNQNNSIVNEALDKFTGNFSKLKYNLAQNPALISNVETIVAEYMGTGTNKSNPNIDNPLNWLRDNHNSKAYHSQYNVFREWAKDRVKCWSDVNEELVKDYYHFIVVERNSSAAASKMHRDMLRSALRIADKSSKVSWSDGDVLIFLDSWKINLKTEDNGKVALEQSEVDEIYNLSLTGNSAIVRDLFIFQCRTGLRYSDINGADFTGYKGKQRFEIVQTKEKASKNPVIALDLHSSIGEILDRYNWTFPSIRAERYNKLLKNIIQGCSFANDEVILKSKKADGSTEITKTTKANSIASHTGRRTFVTWLCDLGYSMEEVAIFTGHNTLHLVKDVYDRRNKEKKAQQAIDRVKGNTVDETNTAVEDITTGDIKAGYRIMIEFLLLKASSKDIVKAAKEFIQLFGKYPIKSLLLQNELTIRRKYNSIDWDNVMILADVIENIPVE